MAPFKEKKPLAYLLISLVAGLLSFSSLFLSRCAISIEDWIYIGISTLILFAVLYLFSRGLKGTPAAVLVFLVFLVVTGFAFHKTATHIFRDDEWIFMSLAEGLNGFSVENFKKISLFAMFGHIRFQPLANLLLYGRYALIGTDVFITHVLNFVLHASTGFMLFAVLLRLTKNLHLSFLAGLVFLVLPAQFDIVSWTYHTYVILGTLLMLCSLYFAILNSERQRSEYAIFSIILAILSVICYEPAALAPIAAVFVMVGAYYLRLERIPEKKYFVFPAVVALAAYLVDMFIAWYGVKLTSSTHTMSLSYLTMPKGMFLGLKALVINIWESNFLKNIGIDLSVTVSNNVFLTLARPVYSDPAFFMKIAVTVLLIICLRPTKKTLILSAAFLCLALSYIYIIALGRIVTNGMYYVVTQPRYQYFPDALLLLTATIFIWPSYEKKGKKFLITAVLVFMFITNMHNILYANSRIDDGLRPSNSRYQALNEFFHSNPSAKVFVKGTSADSLFLGQEISMELMFKGRITKYINRATHIYDGAGFSPNPLYGKGRRSGSVGDFSISFSYTPAYFAPKNEVVFIGKDNSYPRIVLTRRNSIEVGLYKPSEGVVTFEFPVPYDQEQARSVTVEKSDDFLCVYFNGIPGGTVQLQPGYAQFEGDGLDLYGDYFRTYNENIYIRNMFIQINASETGCVSGTTRLQ